jgi:putative transposase
MMGPISFDAKCAGARSAGNPHAACDVAGTGNGVTDQPSRARRGKPRIQTRTILWATAPVLDPTRRLIALKWTYKTKRVGRPGLMKAIAALIVRMARENSGWGYCRIQGELKDIGHTVASTTIANVLKANGIKPAPDRPSSWKSFLKAHWGEIASMDFFTTEVWTPTGLKTYYVLFLVDLKTRRVDIAGITTNPGEAFMAQVARNLTDLADGFLRAHRFLICDRDTKFTAQFKRILKDSGIDVILTPRQAPNCNAFAERFVLSIKSECLWKMIFFGETFLWRAVSEFVAHYHVERAHHGLGTSGLSASVRLGTARSFATSASAGSSSATGARRSHDKV